MSKAGTNQENQNASSPENKTGKEKPKRTLLQKIVNVFLYSGVGLLFLFLIFLGISQTSTFREFLREKVIELANESLNGTLYIEKIEGTIFTSIILNNTTVNMESDTLLKSEKITLKVSPLQLLLKRIYVREVEISNTQINFSSDENGDLNISKLFPPSEREQDTTKSEFPFKIEVASLELKNINFSLQNFSNIGSIKTYDELNTDDLRIKNLNLSLNAEADIKNNNYRLNLSKLSFDPNISNFILKELSGEFFINDEDIRIRNLLLQTNESKVNIDLTLDDINIFNSDGIDLDNSYIQLEAHSEKFSFNDLKAIVPDVDILHGTTSFELQTTGYVAELKVNRLFVQLPNSQIISSGTIANLKNPENIVLDFDLSGSYIDQEDISSLLPELEIPLYQEYGVIRFDSLLFNGEPLDFSCVANISTDKGKITSLVKMNLKNELLEYDIALKTDNLDLSPFTNVNTNLDLIADVKGKGTSPANLIMDLNVNANGSSYNGTLIDTLKISAEAKNKNIFYNLRLSSDITFADVQGEFDFTNEDNPVFKMNGDIKDFNVARITGDSALYTNLNINVDVEGESFDIDDMNLFIVLSAYKSTLMETDLDSLTAIIDLRRPNGDERVINFISDLADINISGDFNLSQTINLLSGEIELLSTVFNEKAGLVMPSLMQDEKMKTAGLKIKKPLFQEVNKPIDIKYVIELKDFDLLSAFLGDNRFELDGDFSGAIKSSHENVFISFLTELNYIRFWGTDDVYFVQDFKFEVDISNSFQAVSTTDLDIDILITAARIFAEREIYDFNFSLNMANDISKINLGAESFPFIGNIAGEIDLSKNIIELDIDKLSFAYNQLLLENKNKIGIIYTEEKIEVNNFNLSHNNSQITANGFLSDFENQNFNLSFNNFSGEDLSKYLMQLAPQSVIGANINAKTNITGIISNPQFLFELAVDSISYGKRNFGSLKSVLNYKEHNLDIDIKFIDSLFNPNQPALIITGNYPIDLSFSSESKSFVESEPLNIHLFSEGFNLGAFGDVLPAVNKLKGTLTSDLRLTGTPSDIYTSGYLRVRDASFLLEANNLEYNAGLVVRVEGNDLSVDSIMIANVSGTQFGGRISGSGKAVLDNFNIVSSKFSVGGDLKVLSDVSKSAMPSVYGDLVIATKRNLEIEIESDRVFLKMPIIIKRARLTLPQTQSAYGGSENYVYKFVETDTTIEKVIDFETLVSIAKQQETEISQAAQKIIFDFDLDIEVEDEITVVFILSREFNQNLTAVLKGNLRYTSFGGRTDVQGRLDLVEGSTLEFLKTLEAVGSIRFEGDLTNPYLDIVATYRNYYLPLSGPDAGKQIEVAVRLNLEGPAKDINKKLIKPEGNLKVYYGTESIENNQPSPQYDASDAAMFLLLDKFNDDADQQDRNAVASYAAGIAGSLVGGFLNNQFGDIIKSVELRQVGSTTVINIIGRLGKFRYEVGTSSSGYQDISRTNVKIEYPVTRRFFLNLKRKEPVSSESIYIGEMINEFGLKYRFEF